MPTPTTRLRAVLQDPGSNLNVWGQLLNDQAISLLDEAIAGVEKISLTGNNGNLTLTSSNYATDQARNAALVFTGTPAVAVAVTIPAVEKVYVVSNTTTKDVTLSAGGAGVTLAAGDRAVVWCDGTDCGLGSISATTVNGLIANAQLAGASLPGQTGNAGKYLQTDGSVPVWAPVVIPDVGGGADATITTSVTLAVNASVVQSVNMATDAQSVRLPAATSLTKGGRKYVILGVGNRTFGVRDNAGTLLTVVPAGGAAELHLRDNATAAGSWGVTGRGLEPALTLVDHTAPATIAGAMEPVVRLTDGLSLHFGSHSLGFYALAADNVAGAVGAWTVVETGAGVSILHGFRISDTQAIIFWQASTNYKAAVLTVDPATRAITVGTAASVADATAGMLTNVTFSGRPLIAQLTASLYVILWKYSGAANPARAIAVSVSGSTVTIGTSTAAIATGSAGHEVLACYRVSDTTALAIYIDDSGTAGSPYSIRAAVLSVSGTTVTVGTSAGINDTIDSVFTGVAAGVLLNIGVCQLSANKYLVSWPRSATSYENVAAFTVSGTAVSVGSPVTVDASAVNTNNQNANRFQPVLYPLDASRALLTYIGGEANTPSKHVVVTESGGAVTAGAILYSLWTGSAGGNFPQTPAGFLAFSSDAAEYAIASVTINGTALDVTGTFSDGGISFQGTASLRFGLSGGVLGIANNMGSSTSNFVRYSLMHLFKFAPNAPPRYLGPLRLNNIGAPSALVPVEVAANKVAVINGAGLTQPGGTGNSVRLAIVEFAQ